MSQVRQRDMLQDLPQLRVLILLVSCVFFPIQIAVFTKLSSLVAESRTLPEGHHLICVYGDNWLQSCKYTITALLADLDPTVVQALKDVDEKIKVKKDGKKERLGTTYYYLFIHPARVYSDTHVLSICLSVLFSHSNTHRIRSITRGICSSEGKVREAFVTGGRRNETDGWSVTGERTGLQYFN